MAPFGVLVLAAACGGPGDKCGERVCWTPPAAGAPRGQLEVGTGETSFEPVEPEQLLPLHMGRQGCCHLWVHARVMGMDPGVAGTRGCGNPLTLVTVVTDTGEAVDQFECADVVGYVESPLAGATELPHAVQVIVDPDVLPTLPGRRVLLKVEAVDAEGRYAVDEVFAVVGSIPQLDGGTADAAPEDAATSD